MSTAEAVQSSPALVVRAVEDAAAVDTAAKGGVSVEASWSATAAAPGAAASLSLIAKLVVGVTACALAVGLGAGLGLRRPPTSLASSSSAPVGYDNLLTPSRVRALHAGSGLAHATSWATLCPLHLMSGDATDTTAVVTVTLVNPAACAGVASGVLRAVLIRGGQGEADTIATAAGVTTATGPGVVQVPVTFRSVAGSDYRASPGGHTARAVLTALTPASRYVYTLLLGAGGGQDVVGDRVGEFRTLGGAGYEGDVRFLHISCANENPYPVGLAISAEIGSALTDGGADVSRLGRGDAGFDYAIFNGDTVYSDRWWGTQTAPAARDLDFFRGLYADQRNASYAGPFFPSVLSTLSTFAGWDDHEVVNNYNGGTEGSNGTSIVSSGTGGLSSFGGSAPAGAEAVPNATVELWKRWGYQAFFERMPITPAGSLDALPASAPPLASPSTRLFRKYRPSKHVEVMHLDLRQYREPPPVTRSPAPILPMGVTAGALRAEFPILSTLLVTPDPVADIAPIKAVNRTLLGTAQWEWLTASLSTSTATWKVSGGATRRDTPHPCP